MKVRVRRELTTRVVHEATTRGIKTVMRLIKTKSPLLITGDFDDADGGGCVFTWLGRCHPQARNSVMPGHAFLYRIGLPLISEVICEFDSNPAFRAQLYKALRRELFYRKGAKQCPKRGMTRSKAF